MIDTEEYQSWVNKDGTLGACFWCVKDCLPMDFILVLDSKCKEKFPNAELLSIERKACNREKKRVLWQLRWGLYDKNGHWVSAHIRP